MSFLLFLLLLPKELSSFQQKVVSTIEKAKFAYLALEGGSGVIVSPQGEVITNYHVVRNRKLGESWPILHPDGKISEITLVAFAPWGDLAYLQLKGHAPYAYLPLAPVGSLRRGDFVIALGNPFHLSRLGRPSASFGIISSLYLQEYNYPLAILTDAPLNPGNSGGPLINLKGELVGITGKIASRFGQGIGSGAGYAIPAEQIRWFLPALRRGGVVHHGTIPGLLLDPSEKHPTVLEVKPNSPAEKAGFRQGDKILAVDRLFVHSDSMFWGAIEAHPEGAVVEILCLRRGKRRRIQVTLLRYRPFERKERGKAFLGIQLKKTPQGLEIQQVLPLSPAMVAGLTPGDLILSVDGRSFQNPADLARYIGKKRPGTSIELLVQRGRKIFALQIPLGRR